MGNGTLQHDSTYCSDGATRAELAGSVKARRPSRVRVAATLIADAVAFVAASLLAVWLAGSFDDLPLFSRLITPFEFDPHGGTLAFALLTPFWLAALWTFGLYREPARSIGGANMAETLHLSLIHI